MEITDTANKQKINGVVQLMERKDNLTNGKRDQDNTTVFENNRNQPATHFNTGKRVENVGRCDIKQAKKV